MVRLWIKTFVLICVFLVMMAHGETEEASKWAKVRAASAYLEAGQFDRGLTLLREVVCAREILGVYRQVCDQVVAAIRETFTIPEGFSLVRDVDASDLPASHRAAFLVRLAKLLFERGYREELIEVCQMITQMDTELVGFRDEEKHSIYATCMPVADAHIALGYYMQWHRDFALAIEHFRTAAAICGKPFVGHDGLQCVIVRALYQLGRDDEAEQLLRDLRSGIHFSQQLPADEVRVNRWHYDRLLADFMRVVRGDYAEAKVLYRACLDAPPEAGTRYLNLIEEGLEECERRLGE